MNCRICKTKIRSFRIFTGMPLAETSQVAGLYPGPNKINKRVDLKLFHCPLCGHFQIAGSERKQFYKNYIMSPSLASYSSKLKGLYLEQIKILSSLNERFDNFIEVGCGDGSFLQQAKAVFRNVVGIEPSRRYFQICKKKKLRVINKPLTRGIRFDQTFDAFYSRQVFEHLSNPVQSLSVIYGLLNDGAAGLIEVPNGQRSIDEGRYFDLFIDHVNYFTPLSLSFLAKRAGFKTLLLRESFGGDFLEIYIRKPRRGVNLLSKRTGDFAFIRQAASRYKKISVWGAGAKGQSIMSALGTPLDLRYVFDSDVEKHGKYLANSNTKILRPSVRNINENDLIMIFAVSYQDEIIRLLKGTYHYKGAILCLDPWPRILKI